MLAARVKGKNGCASDDIDEILDLFRGFPTSESDVTPHYVIAAQEALTQATLDAFRRDKRMLSLDQAVACLRDMSKAPSSALALSLANLLAVRFLMLHTTDDYEEATQLLHKITESSPGNSSGSGPHHIEASSLVMALRLSRSLVHSNFEDVEEAISRCRSFLDHASLFGNPLHPLLTELLERHIDRRSEYPVPIPGSQEARTEYTPQLLSSVQLRPSENGDDELEGVQLVPPPPIVEKIRHLRELHSMAPQGTDRRRQLLKDLAHWYNVKMSLTNDLGDVEDAIKCQRILLDSIHPSDHSRFYHLSSFGNLLFQAYKRSDRIEYLDESIVLYRQVLDHGETPPTHFITVQWFIGSLSVRYRLFGRKDDLRELMDRFKSGVADSYAPVPSRFELACRWAHSARIFRDSTLLLAYQNAMSLMQDSLVFGPTLSIQYDRLIERHRLYEKTPLDFASYRIRLGQVERAIEALEHGRTLLWSELRGLRASPDLLRASHPVLADRFTSINQELEALTTSPLSGANAKLGLDHWHIESQDYEGTEQLHRLMVKQQEILKERDALILRIQNLQGFKNFLGPPSFDTLRSAASHGPVILINHCKWRSDIIILLQNSPPSLIPTSYKFFDRANVLKNRILGMRRDAGLDSQLYEHTLSSVLVDLYELVGKPVIERFNELGVPEQSRVWWCPTSVFGYLPLHAMGPIPSDDGITRYFSDMYIPSYTTSLSALIASHKPNSQSSTVPSLLLVAQPSDYLPGVWHEIKAIRALNLPSKTLISHHATRSTVLDALRHHRFCHFACHGDLTTGRPFDAALVLHGGENLTLLDIVRSRLPSAEFAFLSSCHTAELSDENTPDEGLHLAAAVHYSGFRSVIGAMWAMADEDGGDLTKYFYRSLFSDEGQGVPYHERSARALGNAVRKLRRKGVGLERWVNFVHFGA
jgi:CHAT domain-containing protein